MSKDRSNVTALLDDVPSFSRQNRGGIFLVIKGPDRGESVRLTERSVAFGSAPSCELCLSDKTVSRKHLVAELVGDEVFDPVKMRALYDLGVRGALELVPRVGEPTLSHQGHPRVVVLNRFAVVLAAGRRHGDSEEDTTPALHHDPRCRARCGL